MAGAKTGSAVIPANHRRLVQSLKEVVQNSDEEIYAMLKECNMDPDETAQKLLSEDTFHVVKRKRDKRKENVNHREPSESRGKGSNVIFRNQPGGISESVSGRRSSLQDFHSTEPVGGRGKLLPTRESGANSNKSSSIAFSSKSRIPHVGQLIRTATSGIDADFTSVGPNADISPEALDGNSSHAKPSSWFQGSWAAGNGCVTMADVLKNGTHSCLQSSTTNTNPHPLQTPSSSGPYVESVPSAANLLFCHAEDADARELPSVKGDDATTVPGSFLEQLHISEERIPCTVVEDLNSLQHESSAMQDQVESTGDASIAIQAADVLRAKGTSACTDASASWTVTADDEFYETRTISPHPQKDSISSSPRLPLRDAVFSGTGNLQDLNLQRERPVIIPDHLRVSGVDYTSLSFGSFDKGSPVGLSSGDMNGILTRGEENVSTLEVANADQTCSSSLLVASGGSVTRHQSTSSSYFERFVSSDDVATAHATALPTIADSLESAVRKVPGHVYPHFVPTNAVTNVTSGSHGSQYAPEQPRIRVQNLSDVSRALQAYSDPPASTCDATSQLGLNENLRNAMLQSSDLSSKFNSSLSTFSGQRSFQDNVNVMPFSASGSFGPILSGDSHLSPVTIPQQALPVHGYAAQHLGSLGNGFGYQYMPQNMAYLNSLYQQSIAGSNSYQLPTGSSFSAGAGSSANYTVSQPNFSGNGDTGLSSAAVSNMGYGNFPLSQSATYAVNPPVTAGNTIIYNDMVSHQRRYNSPYVPASQLEASGMSVQALFPREASGIQSHAFSSMTRQNQTNTQSVTLQQLQSPSYHTSAYSGWHHVHESGPSESMHQLLQQPRVFGTGAAFSKQNGSYQQQPHNLQQTWLNF